MTDDEIEEAAAALDARDRTFALVTARLSKNTDLELELIQELAGAGSFAQAACTACMTDLCAGLFERLAEHVGLDVFDFWQTFIAQLVALDETP